jgi:UDPglucose--hexose-1-phosphate uridylyltransferase
MEPHRRYNPLKDEWLIVAANRVQRPWQGAVENKPSGQATTDDDDSSTISAAPNPLAPGAIRASGAINEAYTSTFVFTNDYPTLKPNASVPDAIGHRLFINGAATGTCRVMCFHPDSRLTLATMPIDSVYEGVCVFLSNPTYFQ